MKFFNCFQQIFHIDSDEVQNILKDNKESIFLMHLLLQIDEQNLDINMIEYIINHIDGGIASKETPIFAEIAKKYFKLKEKPLLNF